ncbi:MAG: NfeD family protein [Pseudomonadota bacterium]|uniref:NfeD family protein n=1 Tax=Sinimarinibacterium flocculans TaxID=985250 RepID=UPI002490AF1D|nr:NfeD family protein [Sinimarinibacterium flocculans]MEC9364308.1 NfeD family protein [Pseudomonadota bacterium]
MTIEFWHWLALGFGLLVLEMFLPTGFIFLWVGAAAVVVGALSWIVPGLGWEAEFILWGALSVAAVLVWRKLKPMSFESEQPSLNRRGHSYVGRTFTLNEPMVNGVGKLRVDDSQWRIIGLDAPAGTRVRVVETDGATLKVEKLD